MIFVVHCNEAGGGGGGAGGSRVACRLSEF